MTNIHANPSTKETTTIPRWRRAFYKLARHAVLPATLLIGALSCGHKEAEQTEPRRRPGRHLRYQPPLFDRMWDEGRRMRRETDKIIEHAAMYLDDVKKFFLLRVHEVLSNLEAFHRIGIELTESEPGKRFLAGKTELTFLYPGSGTHLSPLELAMRLADGSKDLEKIRFIYTEIDPKTFHAIEDDFRTIVDNTPQFSGFTIDRTSHPDISSTANLAGSSELASGETSSAEKNMTVEYTTPDGRTVCIELLFAYKMSGDAFYRDEYFNQADVLVSHDSTNEGTGSHLTILKIFAESINREKGGRDRLLLFEWNKRSLGAFGASLFGALGSISLVYAPYGCGENHLPRDVPGHPEIKVTGSDGTTRPPEFNQVALVYLDSHVIDVLKRLSPTAFDAYMYLLFLFEEHGGWESESEGPQILDPRMRPNGSITIVPGKGIVYNGDGPSDMHERMRIELPGHLRVVLPVLETLDEEVRARFSVALLQLLSKTFMFSVVEDEQMARYWAFAVKHYLRNGTNSFPTVLRKSIYDYDLLSAQSWYNMLFYSNLTLASLIIGEKTGDPELMAMLRNKVNADIRSLLSDTELVSFLLKKNHWTESSTEFALAFEGKGLFVPPTPEGGISMEPYQHDNSLAAVATVLYVGQRLGCPAVAEFEDYLASCGFDTPYTRFLSRVVGLQ